jgi:23S rRNA pseudouridine1911/1915/1917 synthase
MFCVSIRTMEPAILAETEAYLIINKPAGLVVHHARALDEIEPTLVDWILSVRPEIAGVGEPMVIDGVTIDRPGIVHRLDRETSGVMIIAKTQESFLYFKDQFKERYVEKEYHAFVWGHFKESQGVVTAPIGRNKNDFRKFDTGRGVRGEEREATTTWGVLSAFLDEHKEQFSLVQLFPKTGRTHQLRVHMKHLQRPIVSDALYAPSKPLRLGFDRVALHARSIRFVDQKGVSVTVEAPYPPDFEAAIAKYVLS